MNSTIAASIFVLLSSIGLGIGVGYISYELGSESLKGVKSPQDNPTKKIIEKNLDLKQKEKFKLMNEKTILVKVYDHIHEHREANKAKRSNKKK